MPKREIVSSFILEAKGRGKKGKSGDAAKRSRFLGIIMKHMSSDAGKQMANAVEEQNLDAFKKLWSKATSAIIGDLEEKFKTKGNTVDHTKKKEEKSKTSPELDKAFDFLLKDKK